jgi:hypothetical protein
MSSEQNQNSQQLDASSESKMEQIQALWEAMPDEQKAAMTLTLLDSVMKSDYRPWLLQNMAERWPLQTEELAYAYPHIEISELDLVRVQLDDEEISRLTERRHGIAVIMRNHYLYDVFWPELRHVARMLLEE